MIDTTTKPLSKSSKLEELCGLTILLLCVVYPISILTKYTIFYVVALFLLFLFLSMVATRVIWRGRSSLPKLFSGLPVYMFFSGTSAINILVIVPSRDSVVSQYTPGVSMDLCGSLRSRHFSQPQMVLHHGDRYSIHGLGSRSISARAVWFHTSYQG